MRSTNPVMNERAFMRGGTTVAERPVQGYPHDQHQGYAQVPPVDTGRPLAATERMTVEGTVYKTALLVLLCVAAAAFTWNTTEPRGISPGLMMFTFVGLLGTGIITAFRPRIAIITGPIYAIASGLFIGTVSSFFEVAYPGIAQQAALGTITTLAAMLIAYRTGLIKASKRFIKIVITATMGVALLYFVSIAMSMFGMRMPLLHDSGPLGIGISLAIVALAAMNLILDFHFIETAAAHGVEKRLEWFGAFGLLVTLVWLYLELLRLLSKLRD
jgi:uncharacterized YccA/Bax inhibitor family protein